MALEATDDALELEAIVTSVVEDAWFAVDAKAELAEVMAELGTSEISATSELPEAAVDVLVVVEFQGQKVV